MKRNVRSAASFLAAIFSSSLLITSASATMITGTLQIGNGVVAVTGSPSTGCVDFYNNVQACGTPGMFNVDSPSNGVFVGALNTSDNSIKDLQQTFPLAEFISVPDVDVFFDLPGLTLNATALGDCNSTAIDASCSPAGSPFTLVNGNTVDPSTGMANAVSITLSVDLFGYQGNSGNGETAYHGVFSTQIAQPIDGKDANIASVLAAIRNNETLSGNTYSATLTQTLGAPEPGTIVMLLTGLGMMGAGVVKRRRASRV